MEHADGEMVFTTVVCLYCHLQDSPTMKIKDKTGEHKHIYIKKREPNVYFTIIYTEIIFLQSKTISIVTMIDCGSVVRNLFQICIVAHIHMCVYIYICSY